MSCHDTQHDRNCYTIFVPMREIFLRSNNMVILKYLLRPGIKLFRPILSQHDIYNAWINCLDFDAKMVFKNLRFTMSVQNLDYLFSLVNAASPAPGWVRYSEGVVNYFAVKYDVQAWKFGSNDRSITASLPWSWNGKNDFLLLPISLFEKTMPWKSFIKKRIKWISMN